MGINATNTARNAKSIGALAIACLIVAVSLALAMSQPAFADDKVKKESKAADAPSLVSAVIDVGPAVYTGKPAKPHCTVSLAGKQLQEGKDYTLSFKNNVDAGTASVTATGLDTYAGTSAKTTFTIRKSSVYEARILGMFDEYAETGEPICPEFELVANGEKLTPGKDYDVQYSCNVYPGTGHIAILGKGNYAGFRHVDFKIANATIKHPAADKRHIGLADLRCVASSYEFTGKRVHPAPKLSFRGKPLIEGVDYEVGYENNVDSGKATMKIAGKGLYVGERTVHFQITTVDLAGATLSPIESQMYTGSAIEPEFSVFANGKTLKEGADYEVEFANNVEIGKATITIKGKGNYSGAVAASFRIQNAGDELARVACMISYSKPAYHGGGYDGTDDYHAAFSGVGLKGIRRSCDSAMSVAIRLSGYDVSFPKGLAGQQPYLGYSRKGSGDPRTHKWEKIGTYHKGDEFSGVMIPGDIVMSGGHVCMYVGTEIAQDVYDEYLSKKSDADLGRPDDDAVWVSAHYNDGENTKRNCAPCIGNRSFALPGVANGPGVIYRCVDPDCRS